MDRPLSARFTTTWKTTTGEIISALFDRFGPDTVSCVQPFGRGRFEMTFKERETVETLLDEGFRFGGKVYDVQPCQTDVKWITVRGLPFEASDDVLREALSDFGGVSKVTRGAHAQFPTVADGSRRVRMEMLKPVPETLTILGSACRLSYKGFVRSCFSCHQQGHIARRCPEPRTCFRCGSTLHLSRLCDKASVRTHGPEVAPPSESVGLPDKPRLQPLADESESPTEAPLDESPSNEKISASAGSTNELEDLVEQTAVFAESDVTQDPISKEVFVTSPVTRARGTFPLEDAEKCPKYRQAFVALHLKERVKHVEEQIVKWRQALPDDIISEVENFRERYAEEYPEFYEAFTPWMEQVDNIYELAVKRKNEGKMKKNRKTKKT